VPRSGGRKRCANRELSKLDAIDTSWFSREFAYGVYQQKRRSNTVSSSIAPYGAG
jgi:hypothetical protein